MELKHSLSIASSKQVTAAGAGIRVEEGVDSFAQFIFNGDMKADKKTVSSASLITLICITDLKCLHFSCFSDLFVVFWSQANILLRLM